MNEKLLGHRAHTVYVGVHLPGERRHRRHHKHHHSRGGGAAGNNGNGKEDPDVDRPSKYFSHNAQCPRFVGTSF